MLKHKGYIAGLTHDPQSGVYTGAILNITDAVEFEGDTPEAAEEAFREAIEDYLSFCEDEGVTPDVPGEQSDIHLSLDADTYEKILAAAHAAGESVDTFLSDYLESAFGGRS